MGALVRPIHDVLVGPLVVEGVVERLAQPRILELLAPGVEEPALPTRRPLVRNDVVLDAAVLDGGEIIACSPDARSELLVEQVTLALESFERDLAIAIELPTQHIEVVLPARDRQVCTPPVLQPVILDEAPGLEAADLVGAGAERHVHGALIELALAVIGAR